MKKRLRLLLSILTMAFLITFSIRDASAWQGPLESFFPSEIVLSISEEGPNKMAISFRMENSSSAKVEYVESDSYTEDFASSISIDAIGESLNENYKRYTAIMENLSPGTTYYYRIGDGTRWTRPMSFETEAKGKEGLSVIYMGDSQGNPDLGYFEYSDWGNLLKAAAKEKPDFFMIGGDLVNDGSDGEEWSAFFQAAGGVFGEYPLMPAMGNHDNDSLFKTIFPLPQNGPKTAKKHFYSFDYGNAHFTVLDSNLMGAVHEDHLSWLESDLSSSQKDWKIVVFHHGVYRGTRDDFRVEKFKEHWVPIFEKYKVSLVLNGHDHVYMRTYPMKDDVIRPDGQGVVYLTATSGGKNYEVNPKPYMDFFISNKSVYTILDIGDSHINIRTKDISGQVLDTYVINKPGVETGDYQINTKLIQEILKELFLPLYKLEAVTKLMLTNLLF